MNWIVNIFLWGCVLPVLPIEYFLLRNEIKFKKNIVVGVTLPYEARNHVDVKRQLERYRKELKWVFSSLLALSVPCWFIQKLSVTMFVWGIWLLLIVVLPNIPYARCNLRLKEVKCANGWSHQSRDVLWVDTAALPKEKWCSPWLFVPAVILCLLPVVWDRDFMWIYLMDAVSVLGCWAGYRYLYRNRAEVVDANRELTKILSHIRRRNWGKVWLHCAYSLAGINIAMWLLIEQPVWGVVLILLLSMLLILAAVRIEFVTRRVQEKLTAESGREWYTDEDDKWIWGLLYYNPNDNRVMINNRVGLNSTLNLARPAGKVFAGLVALVLIAIPFMGLLLDGVDSKPLDLQLSDTVLAASYGNSVYEIGIGEIEEVELLDELPEDLVRVGGIGAQNLLKGRFRSRELGNLTLCLDPQCPPFLLIKTTDGRLFLFGAREASAESIFVQLLGELDRLHKS